MVELTAGASGALDDFQFGRFGLSPDTVADVVSQGQGIRHRHALKPLPPKPDQPVTVLVTVGPGLLVDQLTAYVTVDGTDPAGRRGVASRGQAIPLERVATEASPLLGDYIETWQAVIPGQPAGTLVQYRIEGWHSQENGVSHWAKEVNLDRTRERPARYAYALHDYQPPDWVHDLVLYQIFVDRFAPVADRWLDETEIHDFHGGRLAGVCRQLDYIADLGCSGIWLTPFFVTDAYHGYGVVDYYDVDPRFGTREEFRQLVDEAHRRDIRVIIDFVANHCSHQHPYFRQALRDPASPYRDWFSFDAEYRHGYRSFFDVAAMPQFNTDLPAVRQYLADAAGFWLREYEVDGLRLDYSAGPSHAFWSEFSLACKQARPDCWLVGEVTLGSHMTRTYTGRLDGCLDFTFVKNVRQLLAPSPPTDPLPLSQFATTLERAGRYFDPAFTRPTFLDNHDMGRFFWLAEDDTERLALAAGLLLFLGDIPIIYYGTEVGLSQPRPRRAGEQSRHPMLWGERQNQALRATFQRLIQQRRAHPALSRGTFTTLQLDDEAAIWLLERRHGSDRVLLAANLGPEARTVTLPAGRWQPLDQPAPGAGVSGTVTVPGRRVTGWVPPAVARA